MFGVEMWRTNQRVQYLEKAATVTVLYSPVRTLSNIAYMYKLIQHIPFITGLSTA